MIDLFKNTNERKAKCLCCGHTFLFTKEDFRTNKINCQQCGNKDAFEIYLEQFIVLNEENKRAIAENEIVSCKLNNGMWVNIVSAEGFKDWCESHSPVSLEIRED